MDNLINKISANINLTDYDLINANLLFMQLYATLPSVQYIAKLDYEKGLLFVREKYADHITHLIQKQRYDCRSKKDEKLCTVVALRNEVVMEFGDDYCDIYYGHTQQEMVTTLKKQLSEFQKRERKTSQEINIIAREDNDLTLKEMEIKRTKLDIDLYYEDDFKETDAIIRKRLNKKNDKGIVMLHGLPGTGKTTYLRYLIGKIKKQVLFVPPEIAGQIANPELLKLLIDNPDSVLIIEDAENVVMQRQAGKDSSVSNLLNISDGLLSDFLNVQIICTFNSPLSTVDEALLRKGRLIAKYEFQKLSVNKAQRLSDSLGYNRHIPAPQSLADIFNQTEKSFLTERNEIGFKKMELAV